MTLADTTAAAFSSYARTPRYLVKGRARYAFGDIAPAWFCRVEKLKNRNDPRSVHPNSYIVVEGYPRSANSYTRALLKERIPQSAHIAHHVHLPAQIEMGGFKFEVQHLTRSKVLPWKNNVRIRSCGLRIGSSWPA